MRFARSLAQVYPALVCYDDYKAELDDDIRQQISTLESFQQQHRGDSKITFLP